MDTQDERTGQLAALAEAALPAAEPTGPEPPPGDADFIVTKEHRGPPRLLHRPVLWPARRREDPLRPPLRLLA